MQQLQLQLQLFVFVFVFEMKVIVLFEIVLFSGPPYAAYVRVPRVHPDSPIFFCIFYATFSFDSFVDAVAAFCLLRIISCPAL